MTMQGMILGKKAVVIFLSFFLVKRRDKKGVFVKEESEIFFFTSRVSFYEFLEVLTTLTDRHFICNRGFPVC